MTTSVKYQTNTKNKDSEIATLQQNFIEVLASIGVRKIVDIPAGSHRKSEKTDDGIWIIK